MPPTVFPSGQGYSSVTFPETLPPYIGAVMFETFLYGLYMILFFICVYVLLRRRHSLHWILLASAVTMFALATADIAYTYYIVFTRLLVSGVSFTDLRPKYWLYVTNNVLADGLLLYRCYVVWGCNKRIVAGPIFLLLAGAVCGYLFEGSSPQLFKYAWIYLTMTFILNTILTTLTAGRIWWLASKAKLILGEGLLQRYTTTLTILIESGCLYSIYTILDLALQKHLVANIILDAGLIQVVGIMPTLIIVQVGLGRAVQDMEAGSPSIQLDTKKSRHSQSQAQSYLQSLPHAFPPHHHHSRYEKASYPETLPMRSRERVHCHCASSETFVMPDSPV